MSLPPTMPQKPCQSRVDIVTPGGGEEREISISETKEREQTKSPSTDIDDTAFPSATRRRGEFHGPPLPAPRKGREGETRKERELIENEEGREGNTRRTDPRASLASTPTQSRAKS